MRRKIFSNLKTAVDKLSRKENLTKFNGVISITAMIMLCLVMIGVVVNLATPQKIAHAETNAIAETESIVTEESSESIIVPESINTITIATPSQIEMGPLIGPGLLIKDKVESEKIEENVIKEPQPDDGMEPYEAEVYVTYRGGINIRSTPSTDGEILGEYKYKDKIVVIKKGDGWLETEDGSFVWEKSTSIDIPPAMEYVGKFKITAYCSCRKCTGSNSVHKKTFTGTSPVAGRTLSVDPKIIPLGSRVSINGHDYIAEDTGSAINGYVVDMYFNSHQEALNFGVQYMDIYIYR